MNFKALRLVLSLIFIFTAAGAWAQSSVWVVSNSQAKVYLAGSVHMLRPGDHPLPEEFARAYNNSEKTVFEVLPGEMEKKENAENFLRASIYSDGTSLRDHISPKAYAEAEAFCKRQGYPMRQYQYLRPAMFIMTLTILEMQRIGAEAKSGVDLFFKEKARQDGKEIEALETARQQIGFLALMDEGWQSKEILESIEELKNVEALYEEMLDAWRRGDIDKLAHRYLERLKSFPKLYRALLVDRNINWLESIENFLQGSKNTMVIVGAAHLAGSDGLINLLRKRGYKVVKLNE